ncbi:Dipeptidyl aminopeptidase/acylaminoacyl peptidase [Nonomuraea maritima]|uniref:Dipeptidyl aminopeptidase/acylaminoacyl peptidase n=1 Tax=Nonomuraea maritima TaxID=683260 RepID=A0A1G8T6Q2_9ACTN|nr:prolyl oligopeptidase family serine peptidase [Nonomuraea maritima]SDJ36350.1 Dipeptidyl aminopeptidase/acylaminoacyl peptidase [Nonomuraea maritima]
MPFWPSPITTTDVASSGTRPAWPTARDGRVWWAEDRPDEGGRTTIMRSGPDGVRELLPAPWSARTRVHEYGGRPYAVTPGGEVVFANLKDQRLYLLGDDSEPRPLTPEGSRYADLLVRDGQVWCVREHHGNGGRVSRAIVSVPLDGGDVRERVTGSDFYASPSLSPDGRHLAYVCWNHPRMPWDGTELRVLSLDGGGSRTLKGGPSESVLAPAWNGDAGLYLISDASGWWNLYEIGLHGDGLRALHPAEEEFTSPPWTLGGAPYTVLPDGRLAVLHGRGDLRLGVLDPASGSLTDLDLPYSGWDASLTAAGTSVVGIAYAPTAPRSVVTVDTTTATHHTLNTPLVALPDPAYLPPATSVRILRTGDRTPEDRAPAGRVELRRPAHDVTAASEELERGEIHAFRYPPYAAAVEEGKSPYVIFVHGGPTGHATTGLDLEKAFLTSRGIGVLDVNYGGSTGYGRAYRERLKGQWGVVDVEDVVAAARWLAAEGLADPTKIAVRGGSAGGWTVMAACCRSDAFAGGVSYYGVSALAPLAAHTHDFESRYVEWLVGPENAQVYAGREPLNLVDGVTCPMLLLQGLDDPVVPPEQSEAFAEALSDRGVPCTYLAFEGESHGFRRTETRAAALAAELAFYQQIF